MKRSTYDCAISHFVPESDEHHLRGLNTQGCGKEQGAQHYGMAGGAPAPSTQFSNVTPGHLEKNDKGAPIPANGVCWSISHTDRYVAAVSGPGPAGIDKMVAQL